MRDFKELIVWKKAHLLCLEVYKITNDYPSEEKFGLISQLRRASASVPTNIAEGCGYDSSKQFVRFIIIASGSITEVSYLIKLSKDLGFFSEDDFKTLNEESNVIRRMLYNLRMSQIN